MGDIADKFKEVLEQESPKKSVDLIILVGVEGNKKCVVEGEEVTVSLGNNRNTFRDIQEYLIGSYRGRNGSYHANEMYGLIQAKVIIRDALGLYDFEGITILPGEMNVKLRP